MEPTMRQFDRRIIDRDGEPEGYDEYIALLRCRCCGERGGNCGCSVVDGKMVKASKIRGEVKK